MSHKPDLLILKGKFSYICNKRHISCLLRVDLSTRPIDCKCCFIFEMYGGGVKFNPRISKVDMASGVIQMLICKTHKSPAVIFCKYIRLAPSGKEDVPVLIFEHGGMYL